LRQQAVPREDDNAKGCLGRELNTKPAAKKKGAGRKKKLMKPANIMLQNTTHTITKKVKNINSKQKKRKTKRRPRKKHKNKSPIHKKQQTHTRKKERITKKKKTNNKTIHHTIALKERKIVIEMEIGIHIHS